ncbi:hypothetical protein MMC28_005747 [Mycoblastus sanguinarius]|nr:hypothetical protein [Mycoblastus sanguinarius]
MLDALLQDGLRNLDVDTKSNSIYADIFETRGCIPSLETFVWSSPRLPEALSLNFLRANPQLTKLRLWLAVPGVLLETRLLPLLLSSFSNLNSLHLTWKGNNIPDSAIEQIGSLKSLEQLHLSAGDQVGWRHEWMINHDSMRNHLYKLPLLKRLAFSRDTYKTGLSWVNVDMYYENKTLNNERPEDLEAPREVNDKIWEREHRERMMSEAKKYAVVIPNLSWMYFGQLSMGVLDMDDGVRREAIILSKSRSGCLARLNTMFGWKTH